ncbi:TonB-dependent receptor plug domain-containing protein [Pelagicoccus albus]|uniref:TonB-dependent receptor n=1 Tax=Pelagicoccus albus TaxID=415222 RepID=A0A7X1B9H6_9BACT|nr:TonB-dependent receptor plug domain-containing protein [Pelagicoccus albus]MBC2608172.1 TonB-dependent receptor [Pelagicoccus albus]
MRKTHKSLFISGLAVASYVSSASTVADELADLSLEELSGVPIVESAKKSQNLFDTPASAFVFDEEAIQNLPVDSIPEMLRYAPGVHMTRASNGIWGLAVRGMNSRFLGRTQFTVDDQNLYGTVFAGLYGAQHDLFLDDVASVEVVYGPGGGLWGVNANNGQVNVIMKSAFETEGNVLRTQIGTEQNSVAGRVGWAIGEKSAIRVFAKATHRKASESDLFEDDWDIYRTGVQFDTRPSTSDLFTISAEAYKSDLGFANNSADLSTGNYGLSVGEELHQGFNAQTKWTHQTDSESGFTVRSWLGYTELRAAYGNYNYSIWGLESRMRKKISDKQRLTITTTASVDQAELLDSVNIIFQPDYDEHSYNANAGAEYTYSLIPDKREISAGLSSQYDSYSDEVEILPSFRVMERLNEKTRIWFSYSKSTRSVPNGLNDFSYFVYYGLPMETVQIPTPLGNIPVSTQIVAAIEGGNMQNEQQNSYEIGFRHQFSDTSNLTLNTFYYVYRDLLGATDAPIEPVLTVPNPYLLTPSYVENSAEGEAYGFELSWDAALSKKFEVKLNYAFLQDSFQAILSGVENPAYILFQLGDVKNLDNNAPEHSASAWLLTNLSEEWQFDLGLRATSSYTNPEFKQPSIFQSDARLSWNPNDTLRLSLVGRNLLDPRTDESHLRHNIGFGTEQARELSVELRYEF